jgi:hypothetical protein
MQGRREGSVHPDRNVRYASVHQVQGAVERFYTVSECPEYIKFIGTDGLLYCKLKKAMYGCVQASKLWYKKLRIFLLQQGYEHCEVDPCLFRKVRGEKTYLLVIYVDDILIIAEQEEIERLEKEFTKEVLWITIVVSNKQSYLGMQIKVGDGKMFLDMRYYLEKVLPEHDHLQVLVGPGSKEGFAVDLSSPVLEEEQKKNFHTNVAKLLYLSKRARPDVIAIVGFLCTKVKAPTKEDWKKLQRVIGYLKGTKSCTMEMKPMGIFRFIG